MYVSSTSSTSHFLPQTAKRFDSVSFAAFRLRCPGCRNSVAFEFWLIPIEHTFFRKRRNALTQCVSRHSDFDDPVAKIQLPLNFGRSFLSMYASATYSIAHFLPQTAKRFDSVSFPAFRLRCPGCRNSVAFEFRVIPLEHVCFCYLFYIKLPSANSETLSLEKRFDSVSFAAFRLRCPGCRNSVAFEFWLIPIEHLPLNFGRSFLSMYASATYSIAHFLPQTAKRFDSVSFPAFRLRCPGCRNSVAFEFQVIPLEHVSFCYLFYIKLPSANSETL
ncbi:hypothetical protein D5086_033987 [Populus alba]|uniref:Uncharacterized protein n=1 Tax=Populus alba TaxID=43335 RepID=A0ACC4AEJ5_POPAL